MSALARPNSGLSPTDSMRLDVALGPVFDAHFLDDKGRADMWSGVVLSNPLLAAFIVPAIGQGFVALPR